MMKFCEPWQRLGLTEEQKRNLAWADGCPSFEGKGMEWIVFEGGSFVFQTIEKVLEKNRKEVMILPAGYYYGDGERTYIRTK